MEREPSALDFGETIESLRDEVESMWNDIKTSFDKLDREIDRTITQYKPSSFNTTSILYEDDDDDDHHEDSLHPYDHSMYPSVSTASGSGSSLHRIHHAHTLSPIQQEFNQIMQPSPAPPRQLSYSTPIQSHIISNQYFEDRLRRYDSNHSDVTDEEEEEEATLPSPKINIAFSRGDKLFSDFHLDENEKKIAGMEHDHSDTLNMDRDSEDDRRTENNPRKDIMNDDRHQHTQKLDDSDHSNEDEDQDQESGHSMEKLFRDNHTESSFDDEEDSDGGDSVIVLSTQQQEQKQNRIKNSSKRPSLTAPQGLSNIDITAELAKSAKHKTKSHKSDSPKHKSQHKSQRKAKTRESDDEDKKMEEEGKDQYPGALPTIPQTSSVDHTVETNEKTSADIISRHEKKKSLSQMMIQDLELDRKFNVESNTKRKSKKTNPSPNIQAIEMKASQPLTPLALLTQIGVDMPDIDHLIEEFQLTTIHHTDRNINVSSNTATSVPSPPVLNGGSLTRNSRKFTPNMIGSSDYIDIFNEDQELNSETDFKHPLEMGSRVSINANQFITDINYANNHHLQCGINRADSDYKPMINKDIDAILKEMQSDTDAPPKKALSPVRKSLHKVSYSFDDTNTLFDKTPIIDEETLEFDEQEEEPEEEECSVQFNKIEETILIIKEEGVQFINEICDRLVNDDDFYIKQVKEIQRSYPEYQDIYSFLKQITKRSNASVKSAALLFNELSSNERFAVMPLYRSNAITYLYECCTRYQSLQLLDDEVLSINNRQPNHNHNNDGNSYMDHYHLKKPTDELQALDNVHFDDYNEYPSDEDRKEEENRTIKQEKVNSVNETLRELFKTQHVYCPKNINEHNVIKQVLWPHTSYNTYHDKYEYVDSIAIIKPNALKHYEMIIRATLIGNGFLVSKCKAIKYSAHDDALYRIMHCMDSNSDYQRDPQLQNQMMQYLSSATCGVMIIKKAIGVDTCLNAKQCFNQLSELIGCVDPQIDRKKDENTQSIRGCFGDDLIHNAIDVTLTKKDFQRIYSIVF